MVETIQADTGISVQIILAASALGLTLVGTLVGSLRWLDGRFKSGLDAVKTDVTAMASDLKREIRSVDERYRDDRLTLEGRLARLEAQGHALHAVGQ